MRRPIKRRKGSGPAEGSPHLNAAAVLRAIAIALIVVTVLAGGAEIAARMGLIGEKEDSGEEYREFQSHPTLFWQLKPNLDMKSTNGSVSFTIRTNSLGLRSPEIPVRKPAGGFRILCLGDSITYGYGVESNQTYEALLERSLRARFPGRSIDVINGGCPGYSSYQGVELFNGIASKYEPDVVVLGFVYADPATEAGSDRDRSLRSPLLRRLHLTLNVSQLYRNFHRKKLESQIPRGPRSSDIVRVNRVPLDEYTSILKEFFTTMEARKGHVIYLNLAKTRGMADVTHWLDPDQARYDGYRKAQYEVAQETKSPFINFDAIFKEDTSLFLDPIHPGPKGFAIMAAQIERIIVERGWIK